MRGMSQEEQRAWYETALKQGGEESRFRQLHRGHKVEESSFQGYILIECYTCDDYIVVNE